MWLLLFLFCLPARAATLAEERAYVAKFEPRLQKVLKRKGRSIASVEPSWDKKITPPQPIAGQWVVVVAKSEALKLKELLPRLSLRPMYASQILPGLFVVKAADDPCDAIRSAVSGVEACSPDRNTEAQLRSLEDECEREMTQVDQKLAIFARELTQKIPGSCTVPNATEIPAVGRYKSGQGNRISNVARTRFKEFGVLPQDWAQQLVGSDLLRIHLADHRNFAPVQIGVTDAEFVPQCLSAQDRISSTSLFMPEAQGRACTGEGLATHGNGVHNLIAHAERGSEVTGSATYILSDHTAGAQGDTRGVRIAEFFHQQGVRVLNFSGGSLGRRDLDVAAFQALRARGTMLVQASGNGGPGPVDAETKAMGGLTVGSVDADGELSSFCNCVGADIAAPSGDHIQSYLPDGNATRFGGTSGAAPMVAGLMGSLFAVAPGLRDAEARILAARTAVPLGGQAPAMVNGLKLVMAGERIERACASEPNYAACARAEINSGKALDFKLRAEVMADRARSLLASGDCESRQLAAQLLRYAFLLEPEASRASEVAAAYDALGSPTMARFFLRSAGLAHSPTQMKK